MLRERPPIEPRPAFTSDLRSRLMAAADTMLAPTPRLRQAPPRRVGRRWRTAVAASLVVVGASAGVAVAAQGAVPGDTLYPIKRSIESAQVNLNTSDTAKAVDMLGQAGTRLDEVDTLARDGRSTEAVTSTLADFQKSASHGAELLFVAYQRDGDDSDIAQVRDFVASNTSQLNSIAALAPPSMQGVFANATDALAAIDSQAQTLCITCGASTLRVPPGSLDMASSLGALDTLIIKPTQVAEHDARTAREQAELASSAEAANTTTGHQDTQERQPPPPTVSAGDSSTNEPPVLQSPARPRLSGLKGPVGSGANTVNELLTTLTGVTQPITNTVEGVLGSLLPRK